MAPALHLVLPEFQSFLVLVSRIGGIVAAFPMLGGRTVPHQIKIALVVMLGIALSPLIRLPQLSQDVFELTAGLASELLIGLVIGLAVRLVFGALEIAGELLGVQMGFGAVQLLDPMTAQHSSVMSEYFRIVAMLVFLSLNAHMVVVAAIVSSYETIPPFGARISSALGEEVLQLSQHMFVVALQLSAPVLVVMILINILLAMLGRAVVQINVFVLSFPITILGGLLVLGLALPYTVSLFEREFIGLHDTIERLMRILGHG
ncbi:MAG TPA: flagellar biosynthetic protein FliR [Nitrospiraceae bacterium]|nr:flagellar biosynthetic protein FliR [Nitrospiraceae bacterium]